MRLPPFNIVAIDPGVNGGIAVYNRDTSEVSTLNMPASPQAISAILRSYVEEAEANEDRALIIIEEVPLFLATACPSVSSMAKLQRNYGILVGCAISTGATVKTVTPQEWQKHIGAGHKKTYGDKWKAHLKELAQEAFPNLCVTLKTADALLILKGALTKYALYGTV